MGKSVSYTINAKDKTKSALKSAEGGVKGFAKNLSSLKGAIGGAFAVAGIKMAADKIGALSDAYGVQQASELKLATAAKNNPLINGEAVNRLKATASAMQGNSIYGDEQLIEMQAWLTAQGKTEEQINDIMQASLDLASSGVMPLESAMKNLSKTYSGTAGELAESVPALKELTAEQMANGEAVAIVAEQYKGMAESVASGVAGTKTQIANLKGDIQEQLGEIWTGITGDANKKLLPVFDKINTWLTNNKTQIINVFRNIPEIALTAFNLVKGMATKIFSVDFLLSFGKILFEALVDMTRNAFDVIFAYLKAIGTTIWEPLKYGFQYVIADFKVMFAKMVNFFVDKLNWLLTQYNKLAGSGFGEFMGMESADLMERKDENISLPENNIKDNLKDAWGNALNTHLGYFSEQADVLKETFSGVMGLGADTFGDEFDVFTKAFQTIVNEPLEINTEEVTAAVAAGVSGGSSSGSSWSGSGSSSGIFDSLDGLGTDLSAAGDIAMSLGGGFMELLSGVESVSALINWQATLLDGFISTIAGPLNQMLAPLVGYVNIFGMTLGQMIVPVLQLLSPILDMLTNYLLFMYNSVMVPFANGVIYITTAINNGIAYAINGILKWVDSLPFVSVGWRMSTMDYGDYNLETMSMDDFENYGGNYLGTSSDSSSSGSGATYSQVGDVYITMNIEYNVGVSAFDDNDLAVKLYESMERVKTLGLVS